MSNLYIYSTIENKLEGSGEGNKAKMQVRAFEFYGLPTQFITNNISNNNAKLLLRLPFFPIYNSEFRKRVVSSIDENTKFIYIRRHLVDKSLIKLLEEIREKSKNVKIIFEIPTYPYDTEIKRIIDIPLLIKERTNRKHLYHYVDRIVTTSQDKKIFNVQCISMKNGIDPDIIKKRSPLGQKRNELHILALALFQISHGYERLLTGLANYYRNTTDPMKIVIHFVGEGNVLGEYKSLVEQHHLQDSVVFHGKKFGSELDDMFNLCQIAVSVLGWYKVGISGGSPLKTREYCARGIPFVYGYEDDAIRPEFKYCFKVSNDSSPIDMKAVVQFYHQISSIPQEQVVNEMHKYAEQYLSWNACIQPVVDYINS